ncbi:MAG: hypothetical protein CSA22_05120 [Deltaproteobacteria bacterium]|nr:MAG: hypothetical protein CSA22_05120 [Deltaproteobacteria bacterium]
MNTHYAERVQRCFLTSARMDAACTGHVTTSRTRLMLFTAEGVILAAVRSATLTIEAIREQVWNAMIRWMRTQSVLADSSLIQRHGMCAVVDGILGVRSEMMGALLTCPGILEILVSGTPAGQNPAAPDMACHEGLWMLAPVGAALDAQAAFSAGQSVCALICPKSEGAVAGGVYAAALSMRIRTASSLEASIETAIRIGRSRGLSADLADRLAGSGDLGTSDRCYTDILTSGFSLARAACASTPETAWQVLSGSVQHPEAAMVAAQLVGTDLWGMAAADIPADDTNLDPLIRELARDVAERYERNFRDL